MNHGFSFFFFIFFHLSFFLFFYLIFLFYFSLKTFYFILVHSYSQRFTKNGRMVTPNIKAIPYLIKSKKESIPQKRLAPSVVGEPVHTTKRKSGPNRKILYHIQKRSNLFDLNYDKKIRNHRQRINHLQNQTMSWVWALRNKVKRS